MSVAVVTKEGERLSSTTCLIIASSSHILPCSVVQTLIFCCSLIFSQEFHVLRLATGGVNHYANRPFSIHTKFGWKLDYNLHEDWHSLNNKTYLGLAHQDTASGSAVVPTS